MRMKMIGVLVVLLAGNSFTTVGLAQEPSAMGQQAVAQTGQVGADASSFAKGGQASSDVKNQEETTASVDVTPLLNRIATWDEFSDWQQGQATKVRTLYDPTGIANALLWKITNVHSQPVGYLVSTLDGKQAYEFSHRELPTVPANLEPKIMENGYLYAGPMLHLVYVHGLDGLELYNLMTGETLPTGELLNTVPQLQPDANAGQQPTTEQVIEHALPRSAALEDDAFYATGRFGQFKLKQQKGILPLAEALQGDAQALKTGRSFVVYDAIPDKLTVPLAMTKVVQQGAMTYVGLQDPFAETEVKQLPVYIDSRFPVYAVPLGAPPKTPSAT